MLSFGMQFMWFFSIFLLWNGFIDESKAIVNQRHSLACFGQRPLLQNMYSRRHNIYFWKKNERPLICSASLPDVLKLLQTYDFFSPGKLPSNFNHACDYSWDRRTLFQICCSASLAISVTASGDGVTDRTKITLSITLSWPSERVFQNLSFLTSHTSCIPHPYY